MTSAYLLSGALGKSHKKEDQERSPKSPDFGATQPGNVFFPTSGDVDSSTISTEKELFTYLKPLSESPTKISGG